jgi:hypothetical protein
MPSTLKIYLSVQMYEAIEDFIVTGQQFPGDLYQRFLSWTRHTAGRN